jgi:hypothetical protein
MDGMLYDVDWHMAECSPEINVHRLPYFARMGLVHTGRRSRLLDGRRDADRMKLVVAMSDVAMIGRRRAFRRVHAVSHVFMTSCHTCTCTCYMYM